MSTPQNNTQRGHFARKSFLTGAALAALSALPAQATDSGLGFYPTADIYPRGNFHLDVDTFGRGVKTDAVNSVGLEYGFGPQTDGLFGRNELGFDYVISGFGEDSASDRVTLNFKTQLYNNSEKNERISFGFAGLGKKDASSAIDLRLLGYKGFSFGRIHAGVWKAIERNDSGVDSAGLQLGFDRSVSKRTIVGVDWRSGPTGYLAPCIIYNVNDKAGFEIAVGRANKSETSPRWLTYIAFDYNFGGDTPPPNAPNLETTPETVAPAPGTP